MSSEGFTLVLEGVDGDSPETLRKIKGTLLGDIGLTVTEAQTVLNSLPFPLCSSPREGELANLHALLSAAGARVTIVRPTPHGVGEPQSESAPKSPSILGGALDFFLAPEEHSRPHEEHPAPLEAIDSALDFFVEPATSESALFDSTAASTPHPERLKDHADPDPPELRLELLPVEDLPPLKETLVSEAPLELGVSPHPIEQVSPEKKEAGFAPRAPQESTSQTPTLSTPPQREAPAALPKFSDPPHHVPIGRQMSGVAEPSTENLEQRVESGRIYLPLITPELVIGLSGALAALALINWWIFAG